MHDRLLPTAKKTHQKNKKEQYYGAVRESIFIICINTAEIFRPRSFTFLRRLMDTTCRIPAPRLTGPNQITDYLYISNSKAARDNSVLTRLKISCIISATLGTDDISFPSVEYLRLSVADSPSARLQEHFDTVADKIHAVKAQHGRVLVHCCAGVSRSAALCLAYLMKYRDMSLMDAHALIKACRPIVRPNGGFWEQLIAYEHSLRGANSVRMVTSPLGWIPDLYANSIKYLVPLLK